MKKHKSRLVGFLLSTLLVLAGCNGSGSDNSDRGKSVIDMVVDGGQDGSCTPECTGKECGDDGCGGLCGSCPGTCYEGHCCQPSCLTLEGGPRECGDDGCGGSCGSCPAVVPYCNNGLCSDKCSPDCGGKNCGDDGCGSSCGDCSMWENSFCNADGLCDCHRACDGFDCGPDGCGGTCGACACGTVCEDGLCSATDEPCAGKDCGPDGCGGSCGDCSDDQSCTWDGQCTDCQPQCSGKECGPDGCGGSCGSCQANESCQSGVCDCQPTCAGKECGPDGCGDVCGSCTYQEQCESGLCQPGPTSDSTVGGACGSSSDCTPPTNAECFTDLPDGYCAIPGCETTADCPDQSACIVLTGTDEENSYCLKSCYGDSGCRPGYTCHADVNVCWYQPGSSDSDIGGPCQIDSDCKDSGATCYPEIYGNDPTGFVQGYCVIFGCSGNSCPGTSGCFSVGQDSMACLPTCSGDGDCRKGYECDDGICFPYCASSAGCPSGYECEPTQQICVDEGYLCSAGNPMGWCPEDLYCQSGQCGQFDFECTDTTYEPNESKNAAKAVSASSFKEEIDSDLQVCVGDNDWYKLTIPAGHIGTVGTLFYHDLGDLDLCIYNSSGQFLSCRYPFEDYPATWRTYDWNDEFLSAYSANASTTYYFKADGFYGAANNYDLYAWLTEWQDGAVCTDYYSFAVCKGCKSNGQCVKDSFEANLIQFPHPDPADSYLGNGYVLEHASGYNWLRREAIMLVRHAIHEVQQQFPGTTPLGLMDMCQIDGITPGFDVGQPRHPESTHDEGGNIDIAYYQTIGDYSQGQVICDANGTSTDGYYCTSVANHVVDLPRTAYFLAMLAQSDRFRVAGADKLIAPLILEALEDLKTSGVISTQLFDKTAGSIAYGDGWPFHHHHIHVSFKWWSQREHKHDPPIKCGYRTEDDGTWQGYLENYGTMVE